MRLTTNIKFILSLVLIVDALCLSGAAADESDKVVLQVDPAEIIAYKGRSF